MTFPTVEPWTADALCAQFPGDLWYPDEGEGNTPAKRICAQCPVKTECLIAGMDEGYGIWGGLTFNQRRELRRERRRTA